MKDDKWRMPFMAFAATVIFVNCYFYSNSINVSI